MKLWIDGNPYDWDVAIGYYKLYWQLDVCEWLFRVTWMRFPKLHTRVLNRYEQIHEDLHEYCYENQIA